MTASAPQRDNSAAAPHDRGWIDHVIAIARAGRTDRLRDVVSERLTGRPCGEAITSPPLGRDEPDRAWILHTVHTLLLDRQDPDAAAALGYFRRVLVELMEDSLAPGGDAELFVALSWLVPDCGIADDPTLAPRLERFLWGHMTSLMEDFNDVAVCPRTPPDVADLFDLWLTVLHPERGQPSNRAAQVARILKRTTDREPPSDATDEARQRHAGWLLLLFRALADLDPRTAGGAGLHALGWIQEHGDGWANGRLDAALREYAAGFSADPDLAAIFADGVRERAGRPIVERWRRICPPSDLAWLPDPGADIIALDERRASRKIGPEALSRPAKSVCDAGR